MSYSMPGPQRRDIFTSSQPGKPKKSVTAEARQQADRLAARPPRDDKKFTVAAPRPPRPEEMVAAASGPPALQHLFEHEEIRLAARTADDLRLADRALSEVVGDLNQLLDSAATHLRQSGRGRSRQQVKDAVPQLAAISGLAALPLGDVAALLGLPRGEADNVLAVLAKEGGISPAKRHYALEQIEQLRGQLRQVELTKNHSLLDRLIGFIVKIGLLAAIAVAAVPIGAVAVGESIVKEVVKAGITALIALALQQTAEGVRDHHRERDPETLTDKAHAALIDDLSAAQTLWKEPAYNGEHTVIQVRLAIRCCTMRAVSISLTWKDKQQYWRLLEEIPATLTRSSSDALLALQRKLATLHTSQD